MSIGDTSKLGRRARAPAIPVSVLRTYTYVVAAAAISDTGPRQARRETSLQLYMYVHVGYVPVNAD